ncbi:MAG TPA: tRNA lysidine(34) synthetase TilS [Gaiellales bacterium]|nr:tRNA lysidine(34) synthetase TilS [Gaiellales bacterium]
MALDAGLIGRVGAAVARGRLLGSGEPVLVLVSGGADSTLLAWALQALGHPIETLHVAHGLREAESEADAEACRALAAQLGAPHRELDGFVAPGPGVEARARRLRRAAADAVRAGRAVATGHTRDDRVETILYRLAASPGPRAFAALPAADGGGRVRPLLELGREEVRDELRRAGIAWRDDSSNADRSFARNRVRLALLPAFRSLHPAAEANLLRTAALLADDEAAIDALAAGLLCAGGDLSTAAVAEAPVAVLRRALRRVADFPAPRPVAAERVAALARSRSGSGSAPLGAGRFAERRYERIAIVHGTSSAPPAGEVALAVPGETLYGATVVRCALASAGDALDAALAPALVLRGARAGERLPGARRTIARMLLEARVPRSERARYPVVSAHGEPVALPGIAVAAALRRPSGLVLTLAAT